MSTVAIVRATFPDEASAASAAEAAIAERLAACVNLWPCRSRYRWQGAIEVGDEVIAEFKTAPAGVAALVDRLVASHPYDVPAIEWWTAATTPDVAQWIGENAVR